MGRVAGLPETPIWQASRSTDPGAGSQTPAALVAGCYFSSLPKTLTLEEQAEVCGTRAALGEGRSWGLGRGGMVAGSRRRVCTVHTREQDEVLREVYANRNSGDCQNGFNDMPSFMNHTEKCLP